MTLFVLPNFHDCFSMTVGALFVRCVVCIQGCCDDVDATSDPGTHPGSDPGDPDGGTRVADDDGRLRDGDKESIEVRVNRRHREIQEVDGGVWLRLVGH